MESIYLLIPLVLVFTIVAVVVYIWAVNAGQYDDLDKSAEQIIFDDENVGAGFKPAQREAKKND